MSGLFADFDDDDLDTLADTAAAPKGKAAEIAPEEVIITPRNNPDLHDHAVAEAQLLADFNAGRMPHAIVISGPAGVGKATLAYRLARFILSQKEDAGGLFGDAAPANSLFIPPQSEVFHRVASGGHADLLVVERVFDEKKGKFKKEIAVESVRSVAGFLRKTAAEGGWRVVIIDGGEDLNAHGQNALLKILEEPPAKVVLIMTTSHPGFLLPTIRSRCRMIALNPLADTTMQTMLQEAIPGLSVQEKAILLRIGNGSIGRALSFHQSGGPDIYKALLAVAQDLPKLDMLRVHELAEKLGRGTTDEAWALIEEIMAGWCDHIARAEARQQSPADILPGDSAVFSQWQAEMPPGHFLATGERIRQLFSAVNNFNLDKRQAVISAFMLLQNPDYQAIAV